MKNKETTDEQIKNLLRQAEVPNLTMDLEESIMQNLPHQRTIKKQILQLYRSMRLGLFMTSISFLGFLVWVFLDIQNNPKMDFFDSQGYWSYLLFTTLVWFLLFEIFHNAKSTLRRLELNA